MTLPIFASFIVFCIWLLYEVKKYSNKQESAKETFLKKETDANKTRRQSLDSLHYIQIPFDHLPYGLLKEDEMVLSIENSIQQMKSEKIVNFTGISNTELKLQYGAPNITRLMEYDQNYTLLVRNLSKWAESLYLAGFVTESKFLLEFAVSTKSDVSLTYKLLAKIYLEEHTPEKIANLITIASTLNSAMKDSIVHTLQEFYPYSG